MEVVKETYVAPTLAERAYRGSEQQARDWEEFKASPEYQSVLKKMEMPKSRDYPPDYDQQIEKRREKLKKQAAIVGGRTDL